MNIGYGNYIYKKGSKLSKVFRIKHSGAIIKQTGEIYIGSVHFPKHCIGKRVRVKIEFVEVENEKEEERK